MGNERHEQALYTTKIMILLGTGVADDKTADSTNGMVCMHILLLLSPRSALAQDDNKSSPCKGWHSIRARHQNQLRPKGRQPLINLAELCCKEV